MELNRWSFLLCLVLFGLIMNSLPTPRLQKQFSLFLLSFRVFPFMLKSLNCLSLSFLASVVRNETSSLLSAQIAIFPLSCMKGAHPPLTDGQPTAATNISFCSKSLKFSSVQFSCSVISDSLQPHELQHARPPCPSPAPRVYSNSVTLSQWCHPTISSSVFPFSTCLQSFPASGSFPMSQLFASGGQSIRASA